MKRTRLLYFVGLIGLLAGCVGNKPEAPSLSSEEVAERLPTDLTDRRGWAEDIIEAIKQIDRAPTAERVCATIAVIGQESGFQIDPPVKNLPAIVRTGLEKKFRKLGPMAGPAVNAILQFKAPGQKETFKKRIARLRTESDLDRLFRDIESSIRERFPGPLFVASLVSKLMGKGWIEDLNPVTTIGPMQVKVTYAKTLSGFRSLSDGDVRDLLYTRKFGVRAGTARLLDYEAKYGDVVYRFADYNAGVYSSRNAAFQRALANLMGVKLDFDGDLLAYGPTGKPIGEPSNSLKAMLAFGLTHGISERAVRRAADREKDDSFEDSEIWKSVRGATEKKIGRIAPYAEIPTVTLDSPKLSGPRSTEWFATRVKRRYETCRGR